MQKNDSEKMQYSYFYILNSFLKKAKKNNEVGGARIWGLGPSEGGTFAQLINAYIC